MSNAVEGMEQLGGGRFLTDCKGYGLLKKRGVDL